MGGKSNGMGGDYVVSLYYDEFIDADTADEAYEIFWSHFASMDKLTLRHYITVADGITREEDPE
jgi:hypothetical protein